MIGGVGGVGGVGGIAAVVERMGAIESRVAASRPDSLTVRRPTDGATGAPAPGGALPPGAAAALGRTGAAGAASDAHGVMDIAQRMVGGDFGAVFGAVDQVLGPETARATARPGGGVPGITGVWGPPAPMGLPGIDGPGGDYDTCPDCAGKHRGAGGLPAGTPYIELYAAAGERWGIPPQVLAAVGYVESRFQNDVVSSAGAQGVMQFLPSTAAVRGVDPWDPASAIDGAASYLRELQDRFGSLDLALAAYNVGQGTISRAGGILPGSQGERYVGLVRRAMEDFV